VVITISNRYGSGAVAVAKRVAERLGYEYVDQQLPVAVAKRLKTSPQAVESAEVTARSMSERMLRALEFATPELRGAQDAETFDEACLREIQEAVREYAARDNAVILGRGANAILGRGRHMLRVFLYAPRDWRIDQIMEAHGVDQRTAAAEVDRVDRERADYMWQYYRVKWGEPENYDLGIDVAAAGHEAAAELIVRAVELR
jgi:cytidylate kinase